MAQLAHVGVDYETSSVDPGGHGYDINQVYS
jgi:hypothetical protein